MPSRTVPDTARSDDPFGQLAGETAGIAFTDTGLTPKTSYSYAVTAVDAAGNESDPSGNVTAITGPPRPVASGTRPT